MSLIVLGINHKTATVDLREKVAFSPQHVQEALSALKNRGIVNSGVIISTCNRTEIYCDIASGQSHELVDWLSAFHQLDPNAITPFLYIHQDNKAIQHLMRVACGLDSLVLGEPQILGQVKQAYATSVQLDAIKGPLERAFQKTFAVAKRVRTETDIGGNAVSVAFALVH